MTARQVFISYAHRPPDDGHVVVVRSALASLGLTVWSDHVLRARGGTALNAEIADAISASACVVALVSGQSLASEYCQAEIAFALETSTPLVRIDLEPLASGAAEHYRGVLPILAPSISSDVIAIPASAEALSVLLRPVLARRGVATDGEVVGEGSEFLDLVGEPEARIIRPTYRDLKASDEASLRAFRERLIQAGALAPQNGYNALSLAFLHLELGALEQAKTAALTALGSLPDEADAHYAVALVDCAASDPVRRDLPTTQGILRTLAAARRRPRYGAHVDVLTARVIANFYLPRALTPPAKVEDMLALARARALDPDELDRVARYEPLDPDRVASDVIAAIAAL